MMRVSDEENTPVKVWTVSELNRVVGRVLQAQFSRIWVRGEISSFTQAASGHWYLSIKDGSAAVRAIMFRGRAQASGVVPAIGDQFEFLANVTLYEARGEYQLQIEALRRAGRGDLHEAFLRLKEKLEGEGLFDAARRRAWKAVPRAVGVVTSLGAAALHDVLTTLRRRAPHVAVVVYPAPVQGKEAAPQLIQALAQARTRAEVDTLLLVRGGGSIEDLWSFNDEALARTVADRSSPLPVICGVGHETDFTICDFVADARAPTPTAAAELACASRESLLRQLDAGRRDLDLAMERRRDRLAQRLDTAVLRLVSPQQRLQQQVRGLTELRRRLDQAMLRRVEREQARAALLAARTGRLVPAVAIQRERLRLLELGLARNVRVHPQRARERLTRLSQTLQALNPRAILSRGYAIVRDDSQSVIKNALDLKLGQGLSIEFDQGTAQVRVRKVQPLL